MLPRCFLLALGLTVVPVAATAATAEPTFRVFPTDVKFGHALRVTGHHWPHAKRCTRVRIRLSGGQQSFTLARVKVSRKGNWTFRYVPRASKVGAFRWKLTVKQRCGKSSTTGSARVRIHA